MEGKRLVRHLHIYDIGQQEAKLRWLLRREFGHHETCPFLKGMRMEGAWQDTFIMRQQGVWMHYDDRVILFPPYMMSDGGMKGQQGYFLLQRIGREKEKNCSPTWHSVARVKYATIMVQEVFSSWRRPLNMAALWRISLKNYMSKNVA